MRQKGNSIFGIAVETLGVLNNSCGIIGAPIASCPG